MGQVQITGLVEVEVENVGDLEVGAVIEHQISADHDVDIVRGRRWQHHFQLARTRLRVHAYFKWQRLAYNETPLKTGRQTVALCQSGWQMPVMSAVPVVDVALVIPIFFMPVSVSVALMMLLVPALVGVIAIVFVVTAAVIVRYGDGRRQR
jgi:hypothetical protein